MLPRTLASQENFIERFQREARAAARLIHPNVIQIYDYATVEEDSRYLCYMVMTYLPGNTLNDVMEENKAQDRLMPQQQVLQIIKDIAAALDYAHAAGMVHRDVKPGNILFDERGRAILTDFGIARMVEYSKLTQENMAVGTPAYMSPEQAAGEAVDHRTDIYALGVILYELLAGNPPFGDDGSLSVLLSHLNKPVPALTTFAHIDNDYLDSVIFKALAKMPEERYQTATEMADDLAKAIKQMKPAVMAEKTDLSTLVIPVAERAVPVVSPVNAVAGAPMDNRRTRSSTGILLIGLAIIALIVVVTFATDMFGANPPPEPVAAADGSNTIADANSIPSMTTVENMSFFSDFSENDILVGNYWSLESESVDNRPGMIVRERGDDDTYRFINTVPGRAATNMLPNYTYDTDIAV
ncbi:MAG: protein kinase, partial [Chloroflexota bacterium]